MAITLVPDKKGRTRQNVRTACKVCGQGGLEWVHANYKSDGSAGWVYVPFGTTDFSGSVHPLRPEACEEKQGAAQATPAPVAPGAPVDLSGITSRLDAVESNGEILRSAINAQSETIENIARDLQTKSSAPPFDDAPIKADIAQLRDEVRNASNARPVTVTIQSPTAPAKTLNGPQHPMLPSVLLAMQAIQGRGVVYLLGEPASRKSSAPAVIAEALDLAAKSDDGVGYEIEPISIETTETKLTGYRNMATGDYVESKAFRRYTRGGIYAVDEGDKLRGGIAVVLNSFTSNEEYGFPHGMFKRHPHNHVMVMANTASRGGDEDDIFNTGQALDGATTDRYVYIPWELDYGLLSQSTGLELDCEPFPYAQPTGPRPLSDFADWGKYCQRIGAIVKREHIRAVVGGRAIDLGIRLLMAGLDRKLVEFATIWGHMSELEAETVRHNL